MINDCPLLQKHTGLIEDPTLIRRSEVSVENKDAAGS